MRWNPDIEKITQRSEISLVDEEMTPRIDPTLGYREQIRFYLGRTVL